MYEEEQKDETKQAQTYRKDMIETKGVTQHSFKAFSGKNILLVEDNLINQKVLLNLLHLSEMNISVANNGKEAVDMVKESEIPFDLVLMDINMPIMDGLKLVSLVRNDPSYKSVPIVIITTEGAHEDRERALALGANEYITKPIQTTKIIDSAKRLLNLAV